MNLFYVLRKIDWRNFFRKNGPGEILSVRYRGWFEQQDSLTKGYIVSGKIRGGPRGDGLYAAWVGDDTGDPEKQEVLINQAVNHFRSFALPDCRCRIGFHWKCGIHKTWRG